MSHTDSYLYDFIPDVPLTYICVNCNLPLKKPQQISICGHRICLQCFKNIKRDSETSGEDLKCPYDKENINDRKIYPDIATEKELLNWNVKCENHLNDCSWIGPLKELHDHQASCNKRSSWNEDLELESASKDEMERIILKMHTMESRMEAYESAITRYEYRMKRYEEELASYKSMLLEKNHKIDMVQTELRNIKSSWENLKAIHKDHGSFSNSFSSCKKRYIDKESWRSNLFFNQDDCYFNEKETDMAVMSKTDEINEDIQVNCDPGNTTEKHVCKSHKKKKENKPEIIHDHNIESKESGTNDMGSSGNMEIIETDSHIFVTTFGSRGRKKNKKCVVTVTALEKPSKQVNGDIDSVESAGNNIIDTEQKEYNDANVSYRTFLWEPKNEIFQWIKPKTKRSSQQFHHGDLVFQFRVKTSKASVNKLSLQLCILREQTYPSTSYTVTFLNESGLKHALIYDFSNRTQNYKRKTIEKSLPTSVFAKYFVSQETRIFIRFPFNPIKY